MSDLLRVFRHPALAVSSALFLTALSPAVTVQSVHAQEYDTSRRVFNLYDNKLDIDVLATAPGQLQVVRGGSGRVEVAAHAAQGIAAFGLTDDRSSTLRLTALGAKQADYVVIVPERAMVRVRLPGRSSFNDIDQNGISRFHWDSVPEPVEADHSFPRPTIEDRYFVVSTRDEAPSRVRIVAATHVRSLEIRLEGTEFRVASNQPLTKVPGASDLIDIDPGADDVDLMIQVPAYTDTFDLRVGDHALFTITAGQQTTGCGPLVRQKTPLGVTRLTFRPSEGLTCK
jgi:hypothetical protein